MSTSPNLWLSKVGSLLLFSTVFHFHLCAHFVAVFTQHKETSLEMGYISKHKERCFSFLYFVAVQRCLDLNYMKKQSDAIRSETGLLPTLRSFLPSSFSIPDLRLQCQTSNFDWIVAWSAQGFDKVVVGQEGSWHDSRKYLIWIFGRSND